MSTCIYCGGRFESCDWCFGSGYVSELVVFDTRPKRRTRRARLADESSAAVTPQANVLRPIITANTNVGRRRRRRRRRLRLQLWRAAPRQ
jgi:hypothetical protein